MIFMNFIRFLYIYFNFTNFQAHNLTHFLPTGDPTIARFIFSTEKHGYSHLYLVEKKLDSGEIFLIIIIV